MGQSRNSNRNLLKKPYGKRPLEDLGVDGKNITINFQGTRWHRMYWIHLVPGGGNSIEPFGSIKCLADEIFISEEGLSSIESVLVTRNFKLYNRLNSV
jgi:hypothetical protein